MAANHTTRRAPLYHFYPPNTPLPQAGAPNLFYVFVFSPLKKRAELRHSVQNLLVSEVVLS